MSHSETHSACNYRLAQEGGKARCCYCVPHEGCELSAEPKPTEKSADDLYDIFYMTPADARKALEEKYGKHIHRAPTNPPKESV